MNRRGIGHVLNEGHDPLTCEDCAEARDAVAAEEFVERWKGYRFEDFDNADGARRDLERMLYRARMDQRDADARSNPTT